MPRFVISISIFLAIAIGFGWFASSIQNKYDYPVHTWSWWSVDAIRKLDRAPDTVLLGSSLMVVAMAECDATWSGERIDLTTYRDAKYLDDALVRESGNQTYTINLSSPGQIPSDAYLTLKEALNEGIYPERVIYGVAPRDFVDSTMSSAFDTECYKYLSRLVPTNELKLHDEFAQSVGRELVAKLPLLRHSIDLQMLGGNVVSKVLDERLPKEKLSLEKRMALISSYEPLDMVPGFIHAEVARLADVGKLYRDNLADYQARYRKPKESFYKEQMTCFEKLVDLCNDNGIELVVVNMPIRECNVKLLDESILNRFRNDLAAVSTANHVPFVDLCQFKDYDQNDYRDSVHLNGFGGRKFIDKLATVVAKQTTLSSVAQKENRESQL